MIILDTHITPSKAEGQRLSDYACIAFNKIIPSRKGIKKAIKRKSILVDDQVGQSGWKLKKGQELKLLDNYVKIPKDYELDIKVIFEDDQMAIVHKPHGLISSGNQYRNLYNTLAYNLQKSSAIDKLPYPTLCHRLDRETAGCVLVAKTKSAQIKFNKLFIERKIHKTYVAIVHGKMPIRGYIDLPVNKQEAQTRFERELLIQNKRGDYYSKVKLYPITGRTHQLRIHCSLLGHPILGDVLYGNDGNVMKHKGLFLCAFALKIDSGSENHFYYTAYSNKFERVIRLISK